MNFNASKNAGRMKMIQEKSIEQSNGLVAINIPLDQIDENPQNSEIFNMEDIDHLVDGIRQDGFIGAINVFKKPDGRYEISSGHRRYRAMKELGEETIPCIVSPYPDEYERGMKLISSNIRNRDMKPMDWARAINYYYGLQKKKKEESGENLNLRKEAAAYFNISEATIQKYVMLLKLIPELQELADKPGYSYSGLSGAASLDDVDQEKLYKMITEEASLNYDPENGEETSVSRARIGQMIDDIKYGEEPEETEEGADPDSVLPCDDGQTYDIPADAFDGLPFDMDGNPRPSSEVPAGDDASDRPEDIPGGAGKPRYADGAIRHAAENVEKIVSSGMEIENADEVKKYIAQLEKALKALKKMI